MSLLTGLPTPRTLHGSPSMLLPLFPPTLCSTEYPQLGVHNSFTTHFSFCGGGWCEGQEGVEYRKLQLPARPPTLLQVIPFLWASVKMRQNEVMPGEGATGSRSGITCWQADRSLSPGTVACDPREVASLLPPPAAPEIRVRLAPFSHQCSALNPEGKRMGFQPPTFYSLAVRPWTVLSLGLSLLIQKIGIIMDRRRAGSFLSSNVSCINDNERYSAWQQILLTNSDPTSSTECFWPESLESLEFSQMYHTAHPTFFWFSQDR